MVQKFNVPCYVVMVWISYIFIMTIISFIAAIKHGFVFLWIYTLYISSLKLVCFSPEWNVSVNLKYY